jgi:hypothetical protein
MPLHRLRTARRIPLALVTSLFVGTFLMISVTAVIAEDGTCNDQYVCLFEHVNYNHGDTGGRVLQFTQCNVRGDSNCDWQNLTDYGFNDEMSSWRNKKNADAKWSYDVNGGGTRRCMQAESGATGLGDDNDEASAVKVFRAGESNKC